MSESKVGEVWPEYVMLRDTKLHDDMGGLGQRIYTTAGAGYAKRKYIRDDIAALSAHGQPVVDAYLIERVLNTRVPGGSLVWWSINGGGMGIDDGHRNVVRRVLEAYLSMKGSTP